MRKLRVASFAVATLALVLPATAPAQVQFNQLFNSQGPGPSTGATGTIQSGDSPPNGTVVGAVQAIVVDPANANTIYISTPNGGIWKTTNGGANWTPQADNQASTSVASLSLDPTDVTRQTLVAGFGVTSNGGAPFGGSFPQGLLYTTNGGTSWNVLAGSNTFQGQTVADVAARGQTIMAATYGLRFPNTGTTGGLWLSTNGGTNFNLISGTGIGTVNRAGLPAGPVSSLVGDPNNNATFYAAITAPNTTAAGFQSTSIWRSTDSGATWTQIFTSANSGGTITNTGQTVIRLAAGPGNTLAVGVLNFVQCAPTPCTNNPPFGQLTGLFYSKNANVAAPTWAQLPGAQLPAINPGQQASPNFAIAIDPNSTNFVYVSGDRITASPFTVQAFRVDFTAQTSTSITDGNTSNNSTVHADSRSIVIDPNGRLLLSSDGGIYARSNPQNNTGQWTSISGNLSLFQSYSIGYDANSHRLVTAAQDTGVTLQSAPASAAFNAIGGGDGVNSVVNDRSVANRSVIYTSSQCLNNSGGNPCAASNQGLPNRLIIDVNGNAVGPTQNSAGAQINFNVAVAGLNFASQIVLNRNNPAQLAVAGTNVYVTTDPLTGAGGATPNQNTINLTLTNVGSTTVGTNTGTVSSVAYGTNDNQNVIAAGANTGVWLSTTAAANSLTQLTTYAGNTPTSIVFDARSQNRFFVADGNNLFGTTNATTTPVANVVFNNLTGNLPGTLFAPTQVEFISNNGVNALLVAGINSTANQPSPIAVADSGATGNLTGWRYFGSGLPNTFVGNMIYNPTADVLAVGTFGRGAFVLYDVTSYFPQATVLQFGLANNSSTVNGSLFLNDGTVGGPRPLVKNGPGTLLINGSATYTGTTTLNGGTLQLGDGTTTGSLLGAGNVLTAAGTHINLQPGLLTGVINGNISGLADLTEAGPGAFILNGTNTYSGGTTITAGTLQLGSGGTTGSITGDVTDNGVFAVNRSDTYTYGGNIIGAGSFNQVGSGTTIFTGTSTYSGGTTITSGTLQLGNGGTTGSITGNVTNDGIFAIDRSNTYTFLGNISGTGAFQQTGTGTTVFTGTNTYFGTTLVSLGTLQAGAANTFSPNSATTVAATGTLDLNNFNQTIASLSGAGNVMLGTATLTTGGDNTNTTFSGAISGGGGVTKQGTGIFTLSGLLNSYIGPTNINAGVLNVTGSIATSPTFVNSGATLIGTGTVGPTTINASGTLAPGGLAAIGTLGVNGNLIFNAATSQYSIRVLNNTNDRTNATGTATLAGAATATFLSTNLIHNYTIVSAAGGRTGTFGSLNSVGLSALFDPSLAYTPTTANLIVSLDLEKIPGLSSNQHAVANAIDNFFNAGGLGGFLPALFTLTPTQIPAVLNQLSGEGTSGTQETAFGAAGMFLSAMMDQGAFWRTGGAVDPYGIVFQDVPGGPLQYAPAQPDLPAYKAIAKAAPIYSPAYYAARWRAWFSGFDAVSSVNGDLLTIGSANLSHQTAGGAAGLDYQFNPYLLLGLAAGGTTSSFSVPDRSTSGQLDGGHVGAYGVARGNSLYVAIAAAFSGFDMNTSRTIAGIGPTELATSHFQSQLFGSRFEVGARLPWTRYVSLTPFAAVQPSALRQPARSETSTVSGTGAPGLLGLSFASQTVQSLPTFLGLRSDAAVAFQNGAVWAPYVAVSWVHEFEAIRGITPTFLTLPGATFAVEGPRAARDAVRVDVGSTLAVAPGIALFGTFNGEFSDRSQTYAGRGGARIAW